MGLSNVTFGHINNVTWRDPEECKFDISSGTDVWRICVSANLDWIDSFLALMTGEEISQANRFYRINDRHRYIITRGAVKSILGKYSEQTPADVRFVPGKNGKPYLNDTGSQVIFFNISHSADWITLAISKTETGIDVEHINENFNFIDIMTEFFNSYEIAFINEGSSVARFFLLWTRKEALIKATAKGIDDDIRLIPSLDGTHLLKSDVLSSSGDWLISSFPLADNYIAAIAANKPNQQITFWNWK